MDFRNPWRSLKNRVTVVTSAIWLVSLWALTFIISGWLLNDLEALLGRNQYSTATIIADQVNHQLEERIEALRSVAAMVTPELLASPPALQVFLEQKPVVQVLFNAGGYLTGRDGVAIASVPASTGRVGLSYGDRDHVVRALGEGVPWVGQIVIGKALGVPVFSISVPVFQGKTVVGCLVGVINLTQANFLDNITNNSLGETGGYLLVARDQRLIVTATDHRRIMEQLAGPGVNPKIDVFLDGGEGTQLLTNPKGVEVLVAAKQVPLARWYVAVATPSAEAFRPVWDLQNRMLLVAAFLTVLTGLLNWLFLKNQLSPVVATIRTLSDLTESSRPTTALAVRRNDEIGELIESFNRLLRALEQREQERLRYEAVASSNQRLEALGLLAGGIAHDFNNLLAGVFGQIELALLKEKEGPATPYLRKTLGTLGRARSLTQQLLTFSKGGAPELRTGALFPFVEETARFALSGSSVSCQVDVEPGLWSCRFDRNQVGQVIDNLVINAQQAMSSGGTVVIVARNLVIDGVPQVRVSVKDQGQGLSAEVRDHLFEPFFTTKQAGHGLGLSTSYSIVHRHGGTLEAESEPGRGTTFHVTLPAVPDEATEVVPADDRGFRGTGTALVMDDEPELGEILGEQLASFGYRPMVTRSGDEAIEAFRADRKGPRSVTLVILDLTVPGGKGGIEALAEIRALDSGVPVVVASGFSEAPILTNPGDWGFSGAIRKPYLRDDLGRVLQACLPS